MKISLIVDRMDVFGGVETHIRDIVHNFLYYGHNVDIITGVEGVLSDPLKDRGVNVVECPEIIRDIKRPDLYVRSVFELASLLKKKPPDVVHSHNISSEFPARIAARLLSIPSVHTVHGWSFGHDSVSLKTKAINGACHSMASIFNNGQTIFVSDFNRNHGLTRGYVYPETSRTIHNGIPNVLPTQQGQHNSKKNEAVRLVMVSRLSPEKDHTSVLHALSALKDMNWVVDFAGGGESKQYKELATKLGIGDRCHFLGEVEDIPNFISQKDIFILSSHQEGLPISIIEAMRARLPVIASDVGGVSELVVDGDNGYVFPRMDVECLSGHLRDLISNQEKRREMGEVGREIYEQKFAMNKMMSQIYKVYNETIENHTQHIHRPEFLQPAVR